MLQRVQESVAVASLEPQSLQAPNSMHTALHSQKTRSKLHSKSLAGASALQPMRRMMDLCVAYTHERADCAAMQLQLRRLLCQLKHVGPKPCCSFITHATLANTCRD
jgi:hypothetical protein